MNYFADMIGGISHITWPKVAGSNVAPLSTLVEQLMEIEWQTPEEIAAGQEVQLKALLGFAAKASPYMAEMITSDELHKLPILTRRVLLERRGDIMCQNVPQEHAPFNETSTSGSSGQPVYVWRTGVTARFWLANTLRDHFWHRRDFSGKLAIIRGNLPPGVSPDHQDWGSPVSLFFESGTAHIMPINNDVKDQVRWLEKLNPEYILTYPNNMRALLDEGVKLPNLKEVRAMGETLPQELRERVKAELGVKITNSYSSQEFGYIAMECPESGLLHVAENLIVEVLDENGAPCREGETGRVVITDLSNFATPLIRYEIGDYAVRGGKCSCGRGLPTLKEIKGRERGMLVVNGKRMWPLLRDQRFYEMAGVLQYQVIQKSESEIEMRLVCEKPPSTQQEEDLRRHLNNTLGYEFAVKLVYFEEQLPKAKSGKMEDFISEVVYAK